MTGFMAVVALMWISWKGVSCDVTAGGPSLNETTANEKTTAPPHDWKAFVDDPINAWSILGVEMGSDCKNTLESLNVSLDYFEATCLCYLYCASLRKLTKEEHKMRNDFIIAGANERMPGRIRKKMSLIVLYSLCFVVGITGNSLVMVTIMKYLPRQSATNTLIFNLSLADFLVCLLCIPMNMFRTISDIWLGGSMLMTFLCHFVWYVYFFSFFCSIITMTTISLERYIVICYPMKAKQFIIVQRPKLVACFIWVLAAVISIPISKLAGLPEGYVCRLLPFVAPTLGQIYFTCVTLLCYALPTLLMFCLYGKITLTLWRSISLTKSLQNISTGAKETSKSDDIKGRKQVVRMLVATLLMFVICWGPYMAITLIRFYEGIFVDGKGWSRLFRYYMDLLTVASSCVNPIIYTATSRQYREGFKRALCCRSGGGNAYVTSSSVPTVSTAVSNTA